MVIRRWAGLGQAASCNGDVYMDSGTVDVVAV